MTKAQEALKEAVTILVDAKENVLEVLNEKDHGLTVITVQSGLDKLINKLSFLSGMAQEAPRDASARFEPVTEFMGESILRASEVTKEELNPKDLERKRFVERVDNLESSIETMTTEKVLDSHTTPEDQNVLRGVAKRAGLEDYRDGDINEAFVEKIRRGLVEQRDYKQAKTQTEKRIANIDA